MTQPPYGSPNPYGQQDPYGQPSPYGQPVPYQQSDPYGQPAYGQPAYGQPALPPPPMSSPPASSPPASGQPYSTAYQMPPVSGAPVSGGYDAYGQPVYAQQGYAQPVGYPVAMAAAYDPLTGQPYSDKNKLVAGLLQLLPAVVFLVGGIGRLYAGNIALGVTQLVLSITVGWLCFICGFFLLFPFVISGGLWLWFVIDGIMMLAGRPVDGQGRPLRPS